MSAAGVRVGVGTRLRHDGETVEVVQLVSTAAGGEVVLVDGRGRLMRMSVKELLFSDRAQVIADTPDPGSADDDAPTAVVLDQLTDHQRQQVLQRAEHVREVLTGYHIVLRWLTIHDIPRRPPGGASHTQAANVLRDRALVPPLLRPAMTGARAWKRLHAFAVLAGHANYDAAAAALSCHRTTLRDYILRLEHELGEPLVQRARPGRPLSLTDAGRDVLTAIENARSTVPVRQRPATHRAEDTVA